MKAFRLVSPAKDAAACHEGGSPAAPPAQAVPGLQDLLDALPDAVIALARDGALLAVNTAFCQMWDMPQRLRERAPSTRILWHFLSRLAQPAWVSRLLEAALAQPGEPGTHVIAAADARHIECRHRPLVAGGQTVGIVISMRDVSAPLLDAPAPPAAAGSDTPGEAGDGEADAQARLQQAWGLLSRKSEQLEMVMQHMSQGILRIEADGRMTFFNQRLLQLLDLPHSLMSRHPNLSEVQAFQRARGDFGVGDRFFDKELRDRHITEDAPGANPYYVRRSRSGALIEVRTVTLPDGGWLRTFSDVTERLNALNAQSRGEALVRSLVQTLPDCVWIKDPHGQYLACNPAFVQASGHAHDDIVGRRDDELYPPDLLARLRRADQLTMERGYLFNETLQSFMPSRPQRVWEVRRAAVKDAQGNTTAILGIARDITERRRTQDELERSNRLLAMSQEIAGVGGVEVDLATGAMFWSVQVYRMLEVTPGDYTPHQSTIARFIAPEFADSVTRAVEAGVASRRGHDMELQMITATGRRIWVHSLSAIVSDDAGRPVKRISALQDITRRRQVEQEHAAAREAQARMSQQLAMTVSGATLGLWSIHLPSDQAVLTGRWEAILGVSFDGEPHPREMRTQLIHPGDRAAAELAFRAHLKGESRVFEHELRMRHAAGHWIWLSLRGRVVKRDGQGSPVLVAGIAKDISAEMELRHAATRQHRMLQAMIDGIDTGIMINDGERVVYMNRSFRRLLGYGHDADDGQQLAGLRMSDVVAAEDRDFAHQREQIVDSGGRVPVGWVKLITRRGELVQAALSLSRIMLGTRPHYIATASELSEQDMLDVRIRNTQARFERLLVSELEKQQSHIARELHDSLGSELAAISLMVGGLQSLSPRNARLAQALVKVQGQVQSAVGITRMLARGLMPVDGHPGALWAALEQLCANLSALRGVSCELRLEGDDSDIAGDVRNHLYRIAQEAITNAIRHGKATRVEIRFSDSGGRRCMEVEADGHGFDAQAVMGQGLKATRQVSPEVQGGLGLRSIMARAKTIGGSVEFSPKSMGGSCVSVYWPKAGFTG